MRALEHFGCMLAVMIAVNASAQGGSANAHTRIGDRAYDDMAYAAAAKEYKLAANMGAENEHVTRRLADCYMKLGDTENAETWYAQLVKFLDRTPMDLYNYAQALKGNAKYEEAERQMNKYLELAKPDGQPSQSNISDFARKFTYNMDRFTVKSTSINSPFSDMCPAWCGADRVVFTSARHERTSVKRTAAWNDEPFLDLYTCERQPTGDLIAPRLLGGDVNSNAHEGPAVCDASGSTLWYTRNNAKRSKSGISCLGILRAHRSGSGWSGAEPFPYDNTETSVGHPALSPDGKTFYFVSDMPGGFGGSDIYTSKDQGGQWSEPVNLGPAINTAHDEAFPFVGADGTLYFASDGQPGLGGLDIFAAPRDADGKYTVAINVGAPVNGPKDDFGFIIDAANKSGYFTSNRPGGRGNDDIYAFEMHAPLEQRYLCTGTVIDEESNTPLIEVDVMLLEMDGKTVESKQTDANGKYSFSVEKNKEYKVVARMKGRYDGEQHLSTENIEQQQILARDIHMVPESGIWLRGTVRYKDKLGFIEGMTVSAVNLSTFYNETRTTGPGGDFSFRLQPNEEFEVLFEKPGYYSLSVPVNTTGMKQGVIDLEQAHDLSFEPVTIGTSTRLKFVRFDGTSTTLDPVAKTELDGLVDRMQVNPTLHIEVGVHTDARGDLDASWKLSQKRADAILAYLKSKGVPKERIAAKGYGATRLLNNCGPGANCTEAEHAENRRVEYTVTSIDAQ